MGILYENKVNLQDGKSIADFVTLRGQKCCVIKFRPIYIFIQAVQIENMYSCYTVPTRVTGAIGPQYQIEIFLGFLVLVEFLVVERISEHLNNFFPDKCFVDVVDEDDGVVVFVSLYPRNLPLKVWSK